MMELNILSDGTIELHKGDYEISLKSRCSDMVLQEEVIHQPMKIEGFGILQTRIASSCNTVERIPITHGESAFTFQNKVKSNEIGDSHAFRSAKVRAHRVGMNSLWRWINFISNTFACLIFVITFGGKLLFWRHFRHCLAQQAGCTVIHGKENEKKYDCFWLYIMFSKN